MVGFGGAQKATALLPLAVLSAAWTVGLATTGSNAAASAGPDSLPDGVSIPLHAVKAPASLTPNRDLSQSFHGNRGQAVATASASGIPAVALAAYQRAATIIDAADGTCHLRWQLIAAIGRVESDHGRVDGNHLNNKGIAVPGIYGPVLDGQNGTAKIPDTDGGQYDGNTQWDRAVGPMQFIPSTWAIVGVDGDNDGKRNPQDIYDASLAAAVYLCSGQANLSTVAGERSAVFRYNHSATYVDLVLAIEQAYLNGDYSAVPNGTSGGFGIGRPGTSGSTGGRHHHAHPHSHHRHGSTSGGSGSPSTGPTSGPSAGPTTGPTAGPTQGASSTPTALPTKLPTKLPTVLPTSAIPSVVPTLLTTAQAIVQCLSDGLIQGTTAFAQCVANLTGG